MTTQPIDISIQHVIKEFPGRSGDAPVRAVDDVSMDIYDGEFFAMLGPSGCGKTTTLRMIAGFEDPTSGKILLRGKEMQNVPPFHRPVNTVFQDYALFPHMSVLQNVMFGLEMKGVAKPEARKRAQKALEMVRLNQYDRKPRQLSGGQQQRVALARALVNEPAVLLLDEPLGALDLKLRKEMQVELAQMQHDLGITFIFVTHDQEEAMTMADRIAVMDRGKVLQMGPADEIYESPVSRFVADFIGETNFIEGRLKDVNEKFGFVEVDENVVIKAQCNDPSLVVGQNATIAIRPEKISIFATEGLVRYADGSSDQADAYKAALQRDPDINLVQGVVKYSNYIGTDTRYVLEFGSGHSIAARMQNYGLRSDTVFKVDQPINIFWDAELAPVLSH
jgi:spermidine/putrescine transport system ATP-binding protein